ncbi:MAG: IMPACT family protein [Firmicutes bacterium]|nr:IMPACT family protein [Bacillota bacterium]
MEHETYTTILKPVSTELVIGRSRFIGHCREVGDEAAAREFIARIRAGHPQATHNCYAYRIGSGNGVLEYYNDHGEPSGTAGKPILGAIQRLKLTNVAVVVTRYFGGKKLGVRGLIEAYGAAATLVLETAGTVIRIPRFEVKFCCGYPEQAQIFYRLQQLEAEVVKTEYGELVAVEVSIPEAKRGLWEDLQKEFPQLKNPS